jgi:hypothetical protein
MSRGRVAAEGTPLQIKRLAFGGDLVELVVEGDPRPALDGYGARLVEFEWNGSYSRIRLLVPDASEALVPLTRMLEQRGVKVVRAYPLPVSLEDAFIRLTTGR